MGIPFLLVKFLSILARKDRLGSPLYGGMLITRIARPIGILDKHEAMYLRVEPQKAFSPFLYKRDNIVVHNGYGNFSIPNDTPHNLPGSRVIQRGGDADEDEPLVILTEVDLPMDPYNVTLRQFQDNLACSVNYTNMNLDFMMH
ncbi:unnamed protein product [Lactuca saligna]|uniref:Uncharacterized protein n=1 Tax=Lactuca saligna TaxID=75948 RepID=A0AA35VYV4_LACSI|nr:unnamed protein product [Lactuca saligna]